MLGKVKENNHLNKKRPNIGKFPILDHFFTLFSFTFFQAVSNCLFTRDCIKISSSIHFNHQKAKEKMQEKAKENNH